MVWRLLKHAGLLLAIATAGCYRPAVDACLYRCNGNACPNGLECNNDKWCTEQRTDSCTDTTGDGGTLPDASPDASCGWSVVNFDACKAGFDVLGTPADWTLPAGTSTVINTMTGSITGSGSAALPLAASRSLRAQLGPGMPEALVIGVHDLLHEGTITVVGDKPLLILASGTATISGTINFNAAMKTVAGCAGGNGGGGANDLTAAGGGAGGTFGSSGGEGGLGGAFTGNTGQPGGVPAPLTAQSLMPMVVGCAGGRGGSWTNPNIAGGVGGSPGGGIQISARTRILFTQFGMITVNGEGGGTAAPSQAGGGGGGSGGAILLQAPMIALDGAQICANGGGGGASSAGMGGSPGLCSAIPAPGGGMAGSSGGDGAANTANAEKGSTGHSGAAAEGGGGGGGGHGRIRMLGTVTGTPTIMSPAATP